MRESYGEDSKKIAYELIPYTVDENNLAAGHIAEELGENIEQVFKTLILRGDRNGHFVCVVPGNCEVDSPVGMKKPFQTFFHESCNDFDYIYVRAVVKKSMTTYRKII